MATRVSISDARKRLSDLLKNISNHPEKVYEITVNDIVFAELRAVSSKSLRTGAGEVLLKAIDQLKNEKKTNKTGTARNHNKYLYPLRKKGAIIHP